MLFYPDCRTLFYLMSDALKNLRELGIHVCSERGGKTTRAVFTAVNFKLPTALQRQACNRWPYKYRGIRFPFVANSQSKIHNPQSV